MLSSSKNYVPKNSRRLAILPEEIEMLVDTTLQKPKQISQSFEEELHLSGGYSTKVSKSNNESHLTE